MDDMSYLPLGEKWHHAGRMGMHFPDIYEHYRI